MAAQAGSLFLLKDGIVTVSNLRSTALSINNELVDITTKDSAGFRDVLAGAGIASMTISGSGVWTNSTEQKALISRSMDGSSNAYSIVSEDGADFTGNWIVTSVNQAGEHNGEMTYDLTLESDGVIVYTGV